MKNVLVTGASGLVGSWLVKKLVADGVHVVTLIRDHDPQSELVRSGLINKTTVVNGKLEEYADVERAINEHECDTVFHLGAQTIVGVANRSPLPTFEANIRGTYNLLEACRVHSDLVKRVVVASSDKAYGTAEKLPYLETMPPLGEHPYDVSKSCTDLLASTYYNTYKLPVAIARCGNIYGGGDLNWSRIVPGTIASFLKGEAPIIRSDGKFIRDYIYVEDVVEAYISLAENLEREEVKGEAFNFAPDEPLAVLDIVNKLAELMPSDIQPDIQNTATGEIRDQYLCSDKARKVLEWSPKFSLEEGLRLTVEWYKKYLEAGK